MKNKRILKQKLMVPRRFIHWTFSNYHFVNLAEKNYGETNFSYTDQYIALLDEYDKRDSGST
jgi:hypothetical protein